MKKKKNHMKFKRKRLELSSKQIERIIKLKKENAIEIKREITNKKKVDYGKYIIPLISLIILIGGSFYIKSQITGFATYDDKNQQSMDLHVLGDTIYTWNLNNSYNIRKIAVSGYVSGEKNARIYIENNNTFYLIFSVNQSLSEKEKECRDVEDEYSGIKYNLFKKTFYYFKKQSCGNITLKFKEKYYFNEACEESCNVNGFDRDNYNLYFKLKNSTAYIDKIIFYEKQEQKTDNGILLKAWDELDSESPNYKKYAKEDIRFYAVILNATTKEIMENINEFECAISFYMDESWSSPVLMQYNSSSSLFGYTRDFKTSDDYLWRATCKNKFKWLESNINHIAISNKAAEINNISIIYNELLGADAGLKGVWNYTDSDNDTITNFDIKWYLNDKEVSKLRNKTEAGIALLKRGQKWKISSRIFDGKEWSKWHDSSNLKLDNIPPMLSNPIIDSNDALFRANSTLRCLVVNITDNDNDNTTVYYSWYKDDRILINEKTDTLNSTNFNRLSVIKCSVISYDGFDYSTAINSTEVAFKNSAPEIKNNLTNKIAKAGESWNIKLEAVDNDVNNGIDILRWYANDSIADINSLTGVISDTPKEWETGNYSILITVTDKYSFDQKAINYTIIDLIPPRWNDAEKDKEEITMRVNVNFKAKWEDGGGLLGYIFSINEKGLWENSSLILFGGKTNTSEFTYAVKGIKGERTRWKFFAVDNFGNFGETDEFEFIINNSKPIAYAIPDVVWLEDTANPRGLNLGDYFFDIDSDTLTFTANKSEGKINYTIHKNGIVEFSQPSDWFGEEQIYFSASDGENSVSGNKLTLRVLNAPDCGKDGCEIGENCNNCAADCGICEAETNISIDSSGEPIVEEEKPQYKESKGRVFFWTAPLSPKDASSGKNTELSSLTVEQIALNPLPCIKETEDNNEKISFNKAELPINFDLPSGYSIIMPPFNIDCNKNLLEFTVTIPDNYIDIKAMKCSSKKCSTSKTNKASRLKCGDKEEEPFREDYLYPEFMPVNITKQEKEFSSYDEKLESNQNVVEFYGQEFKELTAEIRQPTEAVSEPINPSLKIIGTPVILKIRTDAVISSKISMPYILTKNVDEDSLAVYLKDNDKNWEYLGGLVDNDNNKITVNVENITQKLNKKNEIELAVIGQQCYGCLQSKFKKIYEPLNESSFPNASREAVILVHGLMSSPSTFDDMINDFKLTNQPWQIWTYEYSSSRRMNENAVEFANYLESNSNEYDSVYIVTHSLGGLIAQQALYMSYKENQNFLRYTYTDKVKKLILIGVPNNGSLAAQFYKELLDKLVNTESNYNIFNIKSPAMAELVKGRLIPKVPKINYYVVAGTKPYDFNALFFKVSVSDFFRYYGPNDGIVSAKSAQLVGDQIINDKCSNYWEVNVTHTELIDNEQPRKVIERIISKEISEMAELTPIVGYNTYFDVDAKDCTPDDKYIIIGKKIDKNLIQDPSNCLCGNNLCGQGEDEFNCPSDCKAKLSKETKNYLKLFFVGIIVFILAMAYVDFKKRDPFAGRREIEEKIIIQKKAKEELRDLKELKEVHLKTGYETYLDILHQIVEEQGRINVDELSRKLEVSKKRIIQWAKILEESELLQIHYPLVGQPILMKHTKKILQKK